MSPTRTCCLQGTLYVSLAGLWQAHLARHRFECWVGACPARCGCDQNVYSIFFSAQWSVTAEADVACGAALPVSGVHVAGGVRRNR